MKRKEKIRKILCIAFAFLMSITLFAALAVGALRFTLLDKDFFMKELEKSGYSQTLYEKIVEELSTEGYVSGFDEEFFSQILNADVVKAPVGSSVDRIYGTGEYKAASAEELTEKFYNEFVKSLENRDVVVDEQQAEHIKSFAKECAEFLSSNARLPFLSVGESLVRTITPLTSYALVFLGVFTLFCIIFITIINPNKKESLRYLSYALTGTALMTAAPSVALLITGVLKKISVADKALYDLIQTIGTDLSYTLLLISAITLVLSVILTVLYFVPRKSIEQ